MGVGMVLLTLKPHIVFLSIFSLGMELFQKKKWKSIGAIIGIISFFAIASSIFLYDNWYWFLSLFRAIFVEQKYLGGSGLAASFHQSFANVGISIYIFIPFIIYLVFLWKKKGISHYLFFLMVTTNF